VSKTPPDIGRATLAQAAITDKHNQKVLNVKDQEESVRRGVSIWFFNDELALKQSAIENTYNDKQTTGASFITTRNYDVKQLSLQANQTEFWCELKRNKPT
jgi:hypothetical protein